MPVTEEHIIEQACEAIHAAWMVAKGERIGELQMRRPRLLDDRGLHPYSVEVGRIYALESLLPELVALEFEPIRFRKGAHHDATLDFEVDTALRVGRSYGWISEAEAQAIREGSRDDRRRHAVPRMGKQIPK